MNDWDNDYDDGSYSRSGSVNKAEYNQLKRQTTEKNHQVFTLEQEVRRLKLVTESLWEVVKTQLNVTDNDLRNMIKTVDLKDGKLDGQHSQTRSTCERCNRPTSNKHRKCMYCGHVSGNEAIF